jgi:hypothetical protein
MGLINSISLIARKAIGRLLAIVKSFVERAELDGAIVESPKCVNNAIKAMGDADGGRVLFDAYDVRVVAASGSTEARTCTINELNEIL